MINSVLTRFVLTYRNLVNFTQELQNIATLRCLWVYIIMRVCVRAIHNNNIYGVGYGVAVCNERQYQSLCKWNGNSAVPLFYCIYVPLR